MKDFDELSFIQKLIVCLLLGIIGFAFFFGINQIKNTKLEYTCLNETKYFDNKEEALQYHMTTKCYKGIEMNFTEINISGLINNG